MVGLEKINAATIENQLIQEGKLDTNPSKLFKESEEETIKGKLFWNPTGIPLGNLSDIEEKSKEILCICW